MNPANSQAALAQLQEAQQVAQNPNDILSGQRQQLGAQGAQDTVMGLRGAINNTTKLLKQVAPSVMGRTANSLVTNAQATRQIENEQAPISQNLSEQGTQYNQAAEDAGKLEERAGTAASGIYQGQQDKLSYLQNLYSVLYGRERDAEEARQAELDRQEKIRQFNAQLAESRASRAASNKQFDLSRADKNKETAAKGTSLQAYLAKQYAANPKADRATQDSWVKAYAKTYGEDPNDPALWAGYNTLYPWEKYNDSRFAVKANPGIQGALYRSLTVSNPLLGR